MSSAGESLQVVGVRLEGQAEKTDPGTAECPQVSEELVDDQLTLGIVDRDGRLEQLRLDSRTRPPR